MMYSLLRTGKEYILSRSLFLIKKLEKETKRNTRKNVHTEKSQYGIYMYTSERIPPVHNFLYECAYIYSRQSPQESGVTCFLSSAVWRGYVDRNFMTVARKFRVAHLQICSRDKNASDRWCRFLSWDMKESLWRVSGSLTRWRYYDDRLFWTSESLCAYNLLYLLRGVFL